MEGIADIRRNPWLLDYCFASLAQDDLTNKAYGEKEIDQAKRWFLRTQIPVFMSTRVDSAQLPAVTITLLESAENYQTHADIHSDTSERTEDDWPALAGPFQPATYLPLTSQMTLPSTVTDNLVVAIGMVILDAVGTPHAITDIQLDSNNNVVVTLEDPGFTADFRNATIKGSQPQLITTIESVSMRETYSIGCHIEGPTPQLTYLHSIVVFILLRYKQSLLEARGFESSSISSSRFDRDQNTDVETAFVRYLNITGNVRQYWPKAVNPTIQSVEAQFEVEAPNSGDGLAVYAEESWVADADNVNMTVIK